MINQLFFPHDGKKDHFKALDGLRGLAVLLVLLSHSSNYGLFLHKYLNFGGIGKVGVYLFFVLSAYLLDRQIALAFISGRSTIGYWVNYILRRFLRIYPLFTIALGAHTMFTLLGINTVINQVEDVPLHLLLMRGESIFWSIPVEFKYYLLSPFIMFFCHGVLRWDSIKMFALFTALIAASIGAELYYSLPIISTVRYLPIFLVGTILSIGELQLRDSRKFESSRYNLLGLFALGAVLLSVPYYAELLFGNAINIHTSILYLPYALLWGGMLVSAKYGTGIVRSFLEMKWLRFIGTISFSMYLFHMLVLKLVLLFDIRDPYQTLLFFLLTTLISSVSFLLIERPLAKIRFRDNATPESR